MGARRILLIDSNDVRREARAKRLRSHGYVVHEAADAAIGADEALASPPSAVVAQLWMPSISGVQLCRLLKSEVATCEVPVILCGDEEPRSRFWAEHAGAAAYVVNGRTGELMRALEKATNARADADAFFTHLSDGTIGIRDRIARHLDAALFEAVIASEVRALANVGSIDRLFDRLAQLVSQVTRYRFVALAVGGQLAVHHHPACGEAAIAGARAALGLGADAPVDALADDDAAPDTDGPPAVQRTVMFADVPVATFAIAPCTNHEDEARMLSDIVARDLGGAVKIAMLIEESHRAAATDGLTGLANRRMFAPWMATELARFERYGHPLTLVLLDIDHFKQINDRLGHAAGDRVLAKMGDLLRAHVRQSDLAARWGGEEFIIAYTNTDAEGGRIAAERLRVAIETAEINAGGELLHFTVSLGLATASSAEPIDALVDRADRAMYASKTNGRNQLTVSPLPALRLVAS